MSMQSQRGYSLIEMIAGFALVTVLSGVAVPYATGFLDQYRLLRATDQLAFEINRARMQAIGQNAFVRIRIDGSQYVRERSVDGVTYVTDDTPVSLPSGITMSAPGYGGGPSFTRSGLSPVSTTIVVEGAYGEKTIRTNVLGRVTIS